MITALRRSNGQVVSLEGPLGVLLFVNMGNRGQNVLSIPETHGQLQAASRSLRFVAYHPNISGNFVFEAKQRAALDEATRIGRTLLPQLKCIARRYDELARVNDAVPKQAVVDKRSVILDMPSGRRRVIAVFLSDRIPASLQKTGSLNRRIEILSWPSDRDVLCLYERPGEPGNVGTVTQSVVKGLEQLGLTGSLYGTGRAMSVIRDLLAGERLRSI